MAGTLLKLNNLATITLTDGLNTQIKLPSENLWHALHFRITATSSAGPPGSVLLDGILNLISKLTLTLNGRPLFRLSPAQQFARQTFQSGTQGNLQQFTTTVGAGFVEVVVQLGIPRPADYPETLLTALPAGLINLINLEVACPSSLISAVFGTPGSTAFSSGPQLTVSALEVEHSQTELVAMLRQGVLQGYVQTQRRLPIVITGDADIDLDSGRGRSIDIFSRIVNNSLLSDAMVTNVSLLLGTNNRPIESTHLVIQDNAKRVMKLETVPTGAHYYPFNRWGKLDQFLDLTNQTSVKMRYNVVTQTGTSFIDVIQGTIIPELIREVSNLQ